MQWDLSPIRKWFITPIVSRPLLHWAVVNVALRVYNWVRFLITFLFRSDALHGESSRDEFQVSSSLISLCSVVQERGVSGNRVGLSTSGGHWRPRALTMACCVWRFVGQTLRPTVDK